MPRFQFSLIPAVLPIRAIVAGFFVVAINSGIESRASESLSPFQAENTNDTGFLVNDSLAVTLSRLSLYGQASTLSVYNESFMRDLGIDTEYDLGYYTLGAATNLRNYHETEVSWDSFNTSRVDNQRSPSAILNGLTTSYDGDINTSASNATTLNAEWINSGRFAVKVSDDNRERASFSVNRVLLEDELTVRFDLLARSGDFDDDHWSTDESENRSFTAFSYRPDSLNSDRSLFQVDGNYERGKWSWSRTTSSEYDNSTGDSEHNWDLLELDLTHSFFENKLGYNIDYFHQNYTDEVGAKSYSVDRESIRVAGFVNHDFSIAGDSLISGFLGNQELVSFIENRSYEQSNHDSYSRDLGTDSYGANWTGKWLSEMVVGRFGWHSMSQKENRFLYLRGGEMESASEVTKHNTSTNSSINFDITRLGGFKEVLPFSLYLSYSRGDLEIDLPFAENDVFGRYVDSPVSDDRQVSVLLVGDDGKWTVRASAIDRGLDGGPFGSGNDIDFTSLYSLIPEGYLAAISIEEMDSSAWVELSDSAREAGYDSQVRYSKEVLAPSWRTFEKSLWESHPETRMWFEDGYEPGITGSPILRQDMVLNTQYRSHERKAIGWEFEFVANPRENWRVSINASEVEVSSGFSVIPEYGEVVEAIRAGLNSPAGELPFGNATLSDGLSSFLDEYDYLFRSVSIEKPRYFRVNAITGYDITEGMFKDFGFGTAMRLEDSDNTEYRSGPALAGHYNVEYDFWLKYSRNIGNDIDWGVQLNFYDAFGSGRSSFGGYLSNGDSASPFYSDDRKWSVSSWVSF